MAPVPLGVASGFRRPRENSSVAKQKMVEKGNLVGQYSSRHNGFSSKNLNLCWVSGNS